MGTPTKNSVMGQFVNGRNAQDDFLQLADNHGGTVFAWIDYQGNLQGTFAQATPGGANTDVQYNSGGTLAGSNDFTFNVGTHTVTVGGSSLAGVFQLNSNFTVTSNSLLFSAPANTLFPVQFGRFQSNIGGQFCQITSTYTGTGNNSGSVHRNFSVIAGCSGTAGKLGEITGLYSEIDLNGATGAVITNAYGVNIGINTGGSGSQVSSTGVNVTFIGTTDPSFAYGFRVQPSSPVSGTVVWGLYCDNTPGFFGGGANVTWGGSSAGIASLGAAATSSTGSFVLTQVTNNGDGTSTYTGTISGGDANAFANSTFVISGFTTSNQSNGTFIASASTATTITVNNGNSVNETHAGTAVLVPNRLNLPIATAVSGNLLVSDGGSPQQTSWSTGMTYASQILQVPTLIESTTHTPSSAADTGTTGQIAWDASFIYICTATNTWKRVAIATW